MNRINIDLSRTVGQINRHIFGGFAEHLGRCIYGGMYEPQSRFADTNGFRTDVLEALRGLNLSIIRYPGGNFASGYRWMDGVGPLAERKPRTDLAWGSVEPNTFGTNEFITYCHALGTDPFLVVNAGDGDLREAHDWVEYCNGSDNTYLANLRRTHGYAAPHTVKYWGIGNEVDGPWQIGFKTPLEYARVATEFGKSMKWADPDIKLIASAVSLWSADFVERAQLLIEQAGDIIDYMALHWYVDNHNNDYAAYMATTSELIEERLASYEGLIRALRLDNAITRPIHIAVDEWNVWYRTSPVFGNDLNGLEEIYNLEDALAVALHLNAFIRHANTVKMANIAQIVNVIAPVFTNADGLFLQTIYHPLAVYSATCGQIALDIAWDGDTFSGGSYTGVRTFDVAATLSTNSNQLCIYVVNRDENNAREATIRLTEGEFAGEVQTTVINGNNIKAENSFTTPDNVKTTTSTHNATGKIWTTAFEPHSITALVCKVQ